jgi:hypothetical protein
MQLKPEKYMGIVVYFTKRPDGWVTAGFEKRPVIVSGPTKAMAFEKIKEVIASLDPIVLETYSKYPGVMRELEEM